jgi:hypothetical protein
MLPEFILAPDEKKALHELGLFVGINGGIKSIRAVLSRTGINPRRSIEHKTCAKTCDILVQDLAMKCFF